MKKFLATFITIIAVLSCTISVSAEEATPGASSNTTPGASSGEATPGISSENVPTGIILTTVPATLAAGALILSGIALKKKNK